MAGWKMLERDCEDHGSMRGKDYTFVWTKFDASGVQLPSLMKVTVSQDGHIVLWYRLERRLAVSLSPSLSDSDALSVARSDRASSWRILAPPKLRVWFQNKQQVLLWDMRFSMDGKSTPTAMYAVDAHTGTIVYHAEAKNSQPGMIRRPVLGRSEIVKDLQACSRIDVLYGWPRWRLTSVGGQSVVFNKLLGAVRLLLRSGDGVVLRDQWKIRPDYVLTFRLADGTGYRLSFNPKDKYLAVVERIRSSGSRDTRLNLISLPISKTPDWFVSKMSKALSQICVKNQRQ
jgi:hypothetical protein